MNAKVPNAPELLFAFNLLNFAFAKRMNMTDINTPVTLTPSTVKELKRILSEDNIPSGHRLRIGVKGGGCSGLTYVMAFEEPKPEDEWVEIVGFPASSIRPMRCICMEWRSTGGRVWMPGDLYSTIPMHPQPADAALLLQFDTAKTSSFSEGSQREPFSWKELNCSLSGISIIYVRSLHENAPDDDRGRFYLGNDWSLIYA
jgi:hypothetical protein